jgi:mannose-6-phosphate isomerase-like protein (cupin superfamily)
VSIGSAVAADKPVTTDASDGVVVSRKDQATYVTGRRDWMKYRELGVTEASAGRIRAQVTSASQCLSEPTGWHIHLCEGQFVYMLSGWLDLEFADGRIERVETGDSVYIPGNTPHNEIATSDTFELMEISVPADMGTEPCDLPTSP